ncbi:MAG: diaminopimelate decarboxylase [Mogibacterium sp.]|nr:diaminopimelate decarboxylase [Mogibacterium sp.]MBR2540736.1 diaminopimelate decarboxylase [Mogibacterium sp.]
MLYNNLSVNESGHLTIGGLDATELAATYGTPLYVLDEDVVRSNCRTYVGAMHEHFGSDAAPLYASKALCFKGIYPVAESEGMCVDVVSPGEIYTALAAGFPAEKMFFHGTNKTDEDIEFGVANGIGYFVVDNMNELEVLDRVAGEHGIIQPVLLRLTVGLDPHTLEAINTGRVDSQFGVPIDTGQADGFVRAALACSNIRVEGFHSHVGSQIFESESFCRQVEILAEYAAKIKAETGFEAGIFNIGGGFGVRYTEKDPLSDIPERIREVSEHLKATCARLGLNVPRIFMEPGRSIVADAGVTLYTTGGTKEVKGYRNYVTVDGGMTDNPRYALYKSEYTVLNASRMNEPADYECTIAGRCCESGDRIAEYIGIARPERGDTIAVLTTGAYNYAMASNYNRVPRPAMVMISGGEARLVVRRESFEDMMKNEL